MVYDVTISSGRALCQDPNSIQLSNTEHSELDVEHESSASYAVAQTELDAQRSLYVSSHYSEQSLYS